MFVIGGNEPQAEFTPDSMKRCEEWQKQKTQPNTQKTEQATARA
jgi:hypothetical protein